MKRVFWQACLALVALLGFSGCTSLDEQLRRAAFRATPATEQDLARLPADAQLFSLAAVPSKDEPQQSTEIRAQLADREQTLSLLWLPANASAPNPATVLYLHGVFRHMLYNFPKIKAIRDAGFNVLAVDYRGWGFSTPLVPSEQSVLADAKLAFAELERREPNPKKRVVYGHSMGGAVAIGLLDQGVNAQQLVLESTFSSLRSITQDSRWYGILLAPLTRGVFNSEQRLQRLTAQGTIRTWMLHGERDTTVPIQEGRKLHQSAPKNTPFEAFPTARHSDLHTADAQRYQQIWRSIASSVAISSRAAPAP